MELVDFTVIPALTLDVAASLSPRPGLMAGALPPAETITDCHRSRAGRSGRCGPDVDGVDPVWTGWTRCERLRPACDPTALRRPLKT